MRTCGYCGAGLMLARADAKYCSAKCRVYASRQKFPAVMTDRKRWVRRTASKRPVTISGRPASSTDPATWSTYREAARSDAGVGLGFVLGDGIGCIDLDHCFEGGRLAGWALEIVESTDAFFTEVSQSGDGVHLFVFAEEGPGRKVRDGRNVETYSWGRYIAVTGERLKV